MLTVVLRRRLRGSCVAIRIVLQDVVESLSVFSAIYSCIARNSVVNERKNTKLWWMDQWDWSEHAGIDLAVRVHEDEPWTLHSPENPRTAVVCVFSSFHPARCKRDENFEQEPLLLSYHCSFLDQAKNAHSSQHHQLGRRAWFCIHVEHWRLQVGRWVWFGNEAREQRSKHDEHWFRSAPRGRHTLAES